MVAQDIKSKITELKSLLDDGLIEQDEFNLRRQALLDGAFGAQVSPSPVAVSGPGGSSGTDMGLAKDMLIGPSDRRYRLEVRLGAGGMGEVWKAEDLAVAARRKDEAWVALKVLPAALAASESSRVMLMEEAERAKNLRHPNIVSVHDWREDQALRAPFLVMECLQGMDLDTLLAREGKPGLTWERILELVAPVVQALDYAWGEHRLVHRDLKPANVFVTDLGRVKLLDFGISARVRATATATGVKFADSARSPGYAAPESASRRKPTPRLDVYSLAVMLYQLLERELPFDYPRMPHAPLPDKPEALTERQWEVLQRGFAYESVQRFETAMEFFEALRAAVGPSDEELREQREVEARAAAACKHEAEEEQQNLEEAHRAKEKRIEETRIAAERQIAEVQRQAEADLKQRMRLCVPGRQIPREFPLAPRMVAIPPGKFLMGSSVGEKDRSDDEGPQHEVTINYWLAVGKYPVTFEEWDACVADGGTNHEASDQGWGRGKRPVTDVSWDDTHEYIAWLNRNTGYAESDPKRYRLLSEAEWEYAARAGTNTRYYWGDDLKESEIGRFAVYVGNSGMKTAEVGIKRANAWDLNDMSGNVWEWVEDCWNDNFQVAPVDGRALATSDCSLYVIRGGSWGNFPRNLRSALRFGYPIALRISTLGFRIARMLI